MKTTNRDLSALAPKSALVGALLFGVAATPTMAAFQVVSASAPCNGSYTTVAFSEMIYGNTPVGPSNYVLDDGTSPVYVSYACSGPEDCMTQHARLEWGNPLPSGTYKLTISGVLDVNGNLISPDPSQVTFTVGSECDTTPPEIISVTANCDGSVITLNFNEPMNPYFFADPFNFYVVPDEPQTGFLSPSQVLLSTDLRAVNLLYPAPSYPPLSPGMHVLGVCCVTDIDGNVISGTGGGSYIEVPFAVATEPPSVVCVAISKRGNNVFELQAHDDCDEDLQIFIRDSCDGPCGSPKFAAGPFAPGTTVRLLKSHCPTGTRFVNWLGTPRGSATITAEIITRDEPVIVVTDSAGHTTCQVCRLGP